MAIDASIYAAQGTKPLSVADYDQQNQQQQLNALNLQSGQQKLNAYTQDQAEKQGLRNLLSSQTLDLSNPADQGKLYSAAPTLAPGMLKTFQDSQTSKALAAKDNAQAGDYTATTAQKQYDLHRTMVTHGLQSMLSSATSDQARQAVNDGVSQGYWTMQEAQQKLAAIPSDPQQYSQWRLQQLSALVSAKDQLDVSKPTQGTRNTGNTIQNTSTDPFSGAVTVNATTPLQATPGEVLSAQTSRSNNAANIGKDYKVAGLDGQGNSVGGIGAAQGLIDGIGKGVVSEAVALGRATPALKAQVLTGLATQYPAYVPGQFDAQKHAILAFGSGPLGQNIQTGNTALNHLATLKELASAEANGNTPLFNQIANAYGRETGQAAPTNLQSALTMVGPELTKAVVGAGGGEGDRENTIKALSALSKGSPAQAAGTLATIEDIFGGRLSEQARTYQRTTGQSNFNDLLSPASQAVLARHSGGGATAVPTIGGFTTDAIAAELANRKHK